MAEEEERLMIMTVTGPCLASEMSGVISFHEHLFVKSSPLFPPKDSMQVDSGTDMAHVSMDILGRLRDDPFSVMDNCMLNQEDSAQAELRCFMAAGGTLLVDATPGDASRNPRALRRASQATGVRVVMGTGFGVGHARPAHLQGESEAAMAEEIEREITGGVLESDADNRIRPGLIGAIGISNLSPIELTALRAASIAQRRTGCALMIRVSGGTPSVASACLRIVVDAGGDLTRTCVTGMGPSCVDWEGHKALLESGCTVVYDGVGCYGFLPEGEGVQMPGDDVLAAAVKRAVDAGFADRIMISHGGFLKMHRAKWGGSGMSHLNARFIPRLLSLGVAPEALATMTETNPKRLLTFYRAPPPAPPMIPMFACNACGKVSPFGKEFTKFDFIMCSAPCLTAMRKKTENWTKL